MPRPVSLSLDLLQTFINLLQDEGDAAKTARELGINQPSMSKRLRYLQHSGRPLSRPWLYREGKRWRLTDEGRRVLPAVKEIVRRYGDLTHFVNGVAEPIVRFASGQHAVLGFVREALRQFTAERPNERLRIATMRGEARIERVASGLLDLAAVSQDEGEILEIARRPLHIEPLFSDRFVLAGCESTPWGARFSRLPKLKTPLEALTDFPLILPEGTSNVRKALDRRFRAAGISADLHIVLEIGGGAAMLELVRDGLGIGVVTESLVRGRSDVAVRHLDRDQLPPRETKLICRRRYGTGDALDLSEPAAAFRAALERAIKPLP
ncbi:MAG: LysR family transcriptional regulator [Planctomycetaceae bacterium]